MYIAYIYPLKTRKNLFRLQIHYKNLEKLGISIKMNNILKIDILTTQSLHRFQKVWTIQSFLKMRVLTDDATKRV